MKIIEGDQVLKSLRMAFASLLLFVISYPSPASDASPLAVISKMEGSVSLMSAASKSAVSGAASGEKWRKAGTGDFLFQGDRIKTAKKSRAVINFISGIEIEVNEETEFVIKLSEKQGDRREEMDMILGEILSKVRKGADYSVRTPQAVTAVRGTKFGVRASGNITEVYVFEGMVDVFNSYGKILCKEGEKTSVGAGASPSPPAQLEKEDMSKKSLWTGKQKQELDVEMELKSEKGFIAGLPVEVSLKAPAQYDGKIDVKTSSKDFELSAAGKKWRGAARFKMSGGALTFYCRKKRPGPGVMTIDNDDIKTLITAVNFDEAKEKKLKLKLDDGREMDIQFKK
ncbi:MAG: FecR family protein [Candidatus Omnitrophota bacterium]|nr:FecR domain-containing protein [Candidatus Omnitrophota bacterium]MBU2528939.1 FecR family protein [bacterium]MBU3930689.1 FecR family protein [bacterium]MBU4123281.1 FecR family protein [bacterium]